MPQSTTDSSTPHDETATFHAAYDIMGVTLPVLAPGTLLGRYEIRRFIGHGGHGLVYEAARRGEDGALQDVALKATFLSEYRVLEQEWRVLNRVSHPNLPRYYEAFRLNDAGYLAMEYVHGLDLKALLSHAGGPLGEKQVLQYGLALCDAVAYLHTRNPPILHRDIKPANIRLTPQGRIKLVDFGLAKIANDPTLTLQRGASLAYAPWEQITHDMKTDVRSDVYAIGATLYHLLTSRVPTSSLTRKLEGADPLIPAETLNPLLSKAMADVVRRAMQRQPRARYPNVAALRSALQRVVMNAPALPTRPTRPAIWSWVGQAGVTAVLLAAVVAGGWGASHWAMTWLNRPADDAPILVAPPTSTHTATPTPRPSVTATRPPPATVTPTVITRGRVTFQSPTGEIFEWINVRATPGMSGSILAEIRAENITFTILDRTRPDGWAWIELDDGTRGYVRIEFVVLVP